MAKVYADLIRKGLKTLDDVPARIRDAGDRNPDGLPAVLAQAPAAQEPHLQHFPGDPHRDYLHLRIHVHLGQDSVHYRIPASPLL